MSFLRSIPRELREFAADQEYHQYSTEDHQVWETVIKKKEQFFLEHGDWIDPTYLAGFHKIGFSAKKIPTLDDINAALQTVGWCAVCVDGYLPSMAYANLIVHNIFPVARHIRRMEHIDHSPTPDFIHDVTGHLPMLFSKNYQEFLHRIIVLMSQVPGNHLDDALFKANFELGNMRSVENPSLQAVQEIQDKIDSIQSGLKGNPSVLTQLNRMFLWSIEFGLIGAIDNFKCFGAGMLTAPAEILAACQKTRKILPYSVDVINYDINFSDIQDQFFVTPSYEHLMEVLNQFLNKIELHQPEARAS